MPMSHRHNLDTRPTGNAHASLKPQRKYQTFIFKIKQKLLSAEPGVFSTSYWSSAERGNLDEWTFAHTRLKAPWEQESHQFCWLLHTQNLTQCLLHKCCSVFINDWMKVMLTKYCTDNGYIRSLLNKNMEKVFLGPKTECFLEVVESCFRVYFTNKI